MTKIKAVAVQNKKNGVEEDNTNIITNRQRIMTGSR